MAIGCFLGIGAASTDQAIVDRHREAVHAALVRAELPDYGETDSLDAAVDRYMALHGQARCSSDTVDAAVVSRRGRMIMRARGDAAGPFRDLALSAVACDQLREDAVVVTDPVADRRILKRGERVEEARRQPAESAVAEPRIDFLRGDVLKLVAHPLEGGARLVHQIALEAV